MYGILGSEDNFLCHEIYFNYWYNIVYLHYETMFYHPHFSNILFIFLIFK